jgi:hypothetical protein
VTATARGGAYDAIFEAVDHDVPTDPVKLRKTQLAHVEAAVKAAQSKLDKLTRLLASAPKEQKDRQRAHVEGAKKALAQAIADKKGII